MPSWPYSTLQSRQMNRLATIVAKVEALQEEKPMEGEAAIVLEAARKMLVAVEEMWRKKRYDLQKSDEK